MPNVTETIGGWNLTMVPCFPPGCGSTIASDAAPSIGPIITDARPAPIPVLDGPSSWMTVIPVESEAMAEAEFVRSLYEGVNHAVGQQREADYLRQRRTSEHIAAAGKRGRHA